MKLAPEKLGAHLARSLLPVYVVGGEEPLLIEESLDAIRARARQDGYSEREVFEVERGFSWGRVIESCSSLSLFATRKIVEIRMPRGPSPGRTKSADDEDEDGAEDKAKSSIDGAKLLVELASRPPPDTLLICTCGKLDFRQQQAAWYLALENAGASVYASPIALDQWPAWVEARMRAMGCKPDADAVQVLAERTEGNALAAKQDIDKLRLLYPDGLLDEERVRAAVVDSSRFDAFDLGDRMLAGDVAGVVHTLARLREEALEVLSILGPLAWTLRQWAQAQKSYAQSGDASRACSEAHVTRSRIPAFAVALKRTRVPQIYGWLRQAAVIDRLAKSTGGKEQAWEELLTLVIAAAGRRVVRPMAVMS
ncbi:MAG: DNA polymerase III subunit delta [Panacagrimonas sp.]